MRYGTFVRTDIVPAVTTYGGRPNRTDCVAGVCTYAQEMTNFANWFAYYHTRIQMMKTAAGRVFSPMDDRYRIGFVTINASDSTRYLKIDKFDVTHKADWYTKFYAMTPGPNTPLRRALSRVGRHYAGMTDGINSFMPDDPVQYSCQQNFALLTTDGYWNSSGGLKIDGTTTMDNQDNVVETFVNRPTVTLDAAGTTVTNSSTTRTLEQLVCAGNAASSANFSGTPDTNCGCSANFKRVKQRTLDDITSTTTVDGVAGSPTTSTVPSFQDITACNATCDRRWWTGKGNRTSASARERATRTSVTAARQRPAVDPVHAASASSTCANWTADGDHRITGVPAHPPTATGVSTFTNVAGSPPSGTAGGGCVSSGTTLTPPLAGVRVPQQHFEYDHRLDDHVGRFHHPGGIPVTSFPPSSTTTPGGSRRHARRRGDVLLQDRFAHLGTADHQEQRADHVEGHGARTSTW